MKKHFFIAAILFCIATQTWAINNPATPAKHEENLPVTSANTAIAKTASADLKNEEVQVHPVLSGNKLILNTGAINKARINVINVNGKAVAQLDTQSNQTTLNVSRFPSGNYLLEIWTQDGNVVSKSFTIAR